MSPVSSLGETIDAVVIGASSGGIEALSVLLPALPAAARLAVFIVLHIPRDRPSQLAAIFAPKCALPVREAQDKELVEPGTVYFAPSNYHLLLDQGPQLALSADDPVHHSRPSVDVLFESAADVYGQRLLGIILTGANEDGAAGLARVNDRGGVAVVQEPQTARSPEMLLSALSSQPQQPSAVLGRHRELTLLTAGAKRGGCLMASVKCLIVDDLEENLLVLAALLEGEDVELLMARSGAEALELLLVHDVALAFLDVQMPEMDGFELAELLRGSERTRRIPLIFVTAGAREQQRLFKGYDSGAVDFIYKPIEPRILKNKADVFFELYRQRQQQALELQERTETLRLNEMFSALLAHDLRNPLSAILASAQLLSKRGSDAASQDTAERIITSGRRMARMIEDMLDLARARLAGGIIVSRQLIDFKALLERVVIEHQAAAPTRSIVPVYLGDCAGSWDPERIAQVASNLIGNALTHGEPDIPVSVQLDGTQPTDVSLIVSNGGSIAPQVLAHLFDPFRGSQRRKEETADWDSGSTSCRRSSKRIRAASR